MDPEGTGPRIFFQQVPEDKVAKNRVHLDVRAAPGLRATPDGGAGAECDASSRSAPPAGRHEPDGGMSAGHIVMADPEGNEFCLD